MNTSSAKAISRQHLTKAETARSSAPRHPHSEFRMGNGLFPVFILGWTTATKGVSIWLIAN
jgi:hypothetical protein